MHPASRLHLHTFTAYLSPIRHHLAITGTTRSLEWPWAAAGPSKLLHMHWTWGKAAEPAANVKSETSTIHTYIIIHILTYIDFGKNRTNINYTEILLLTYHHDWQLIGVGHKTNMEVAWQALQHLFPCQRVFQVASAAWRTVASGNRQTRAPVHRSRWHTNVEFCTKVGHNKCIQMWCRYHIWYLKKTIPTQIKGSVCEIFEKVCASNTPPCSPWSLRIPCHPEPRITAKRSCSVHRDDARTALSSHVWARPASERVTQAVRRQENNVELREL